MPNYGKLIAKNLHRLMHENHLNQVELAKKAGVAQAYVSRALAGEMGNSKVESIETLAKALGKDAAWLLTDHSEVPVDPSQKVQEAIGALQELIAGQSPDRIRAHQLLNQVPEQHLHIAISNLESLHNVIARRNAKPKKDTG